MSSFKLGVSNLFVIARPHCEGEDSAPYTFHLYCK